MFKKARGESILGRHNWKLRWFVLESTDLTYFESFDKNGNKPNDVKGETCRCERVQVGGQGSRTYIY